MKITKEYIEEKIEAYNVAISCLEIHESDSDIPKVSRKLREKLIDKLNRELDRWCKKYGKETSGD